MIDTIAEFSRLFLEKTKDKKIQIISHFDTDGICSAAIISKTLERQYKQFSVKILKQLDKEEIQHTHHTKQY